MILMPFSSFRNLTPNPIKTTKGHKRFRSNRDYNLPLPEPNISMTHRPTTPLPISPKPTPLSPPSTPQTRTSPRRSNSTGTEQTSQSRTSSVETFTKNMKCYGFGIPFSNNPSNPTYNLNLSAHYFNISPTISLEMMIFEESLIIA